MKRHFEIAFVFLLIIISLKFFDARFLDNSLLNYLLFLTLIVTVFISVPYVLPTNKGFVFPVQLLLIAMFISIIMAGLYWDQSLLDSLIAVAPYLIVFIFFYLWHIQFPVNILEKIIVFYGSLYILLYVFEFITSGTVYFGKPLWGDEFLVSRGITRIIFPGGGVFVLTSFIAINKLTSQDKNRWFWLLLAIAGIVIPVMQVTRQFIVGILLIYLYHVIRSIRIWKKLVVFASLVSIIIFLQYVNHPIIDGLIDSTRNDANLGSNYIRVLAGEFFLTDFSPNLSTQILGNGVPYFGVSNFGLYVDSLGVTQEYFLSDVGIIAVYVMFGVLAIIAYLLIFIKSFIIPLPGNFQYLKYYLWFMLLTSLTWYTTYHYHYLIITVYVLYMYQAVYIGQGNGKTQEPEPAKEIDREMMISK
ncbi:hypothetical protein GUB10_06350 [Salegentibacter sp. BLCTC]|uniref:hypothetical protein n=1 Tax=Salegentibacter sp. BLCTC TaxID=2697368 RepID=UPI00187B58B5|nr:hypothetical protein [Salegentibacter sp. BLCTC]MBE7639947.1 hypothetical protein [Salegentibacter sp. BLCTC]